MREHEIPCVITYPEHLATEEGYHGEDGALHGKLRPLISYLGSEMPSFRFRGLSADCWKSAHGTVSVFRERIILRDKGSQPYGSGYCTEYVLTSTDCPVIYIESHLTEMDEYAVVFYADKSDGTAVCAIRSVSREDAARLRKFIRRFLTDNRYTSMGGGLYERTKRD